MGILNVTPDSFSGDGLLAHADGLAAALEQARRFVAAGVDFLDVGGESTRPGSEPTGTEDERQRVHPCHPGTAQGIPAALISIDTYKAVIATRGFGFRRPDRQRCLGAAGRP